MKIDKTNSVDLKNLRIKAEELAKKQKSRSELKLSESDALKLIHELEVHQIELELQKEELVLAKEQAVVSAEKCIRKFIPLHPRLGRAYLL